MAIKVDWKIVSNKGIKKKEKKVEVKASLKWKKIWFIDKSYPFSSYEGIILSDEPYFWLIKVDVISKDKNNPFKWIREINIKDIRYV